MEQQFTPAVKAEIMDAGAVQRAITRISFEISERNHGVDNLCLLGILRRGPVVAQRIADKLASVEGTAPPVGRLDVTPRRDDLSGSTPEDCSDIPFPLDGVRVVLVDDGEMAEPYLKHIVKEKRLIENSVGRFLYDFFELLIARDLHRLEEIEDRATALEERVLAGELEEFSTPMSELRKETMAWYRYYSQLDDVACELRENENGYFSDEECGLFRLFEERVIRLREESQLLREYCTQIQSLFQSEIDIRQNRIMQILTIVTTIFLPLTLLVGWYGMNFSGMPELHWKYGYPAIILVSVAVVVLSLWVCKKKKFW